MAAQSHRSDPRILGRRTLERDNRVLARLLRPGMSVLDIGCGTGAITSGIAKAVGPTGRVLGLDRDEGLLELALDQNGAVPNLRFEAGDATALNVRAEFDIVNSSRALQWMPDPGAVVAKMAQAVKPGGWVVVLDYNHTRNAWDPDPPDAFRRFYAGFLAWRQANGWDNEMAEHLPKLFRSAGLVEIESHVQDEIVKRGDPDFADRSAIWMETIESLGYRIAEGGFCSERNLQEARAQYGSWVKSEMMTQALELRAVIGRVSRDQEYSLDPAGA